MIFAGIAQLKAEGILGLHHEAPRNSGRSSPFWGKGERSGLAREVGGSIPPPCTTLVNTAIVNRTTENPWEIQLLVHY